MVPKLNRPTGNCPWHSYSLQRFSIEVKDFLHLVVAAQSDELLRCTLFFPSILP